MVGRKLTFVFVIFAVSSFDALVADEPKLVERTFSNCFLRETEGRVWLHQERVSLGMWGVEETPPFCLSEDLARRFALLVSDVVGDEERTSTDFYADGMPGLRPRAKELVLVGLEAKMRLHGDRSEEITHRPRSGSPRAFYEIVAAKMTAVESVSKEWIQAWRSLDEALKEIVSVSLKTPADAKRNAITEAVDKGSMALDAMGKMAISDDFRKLVSKVEPEAQVARGFQKRVAGQWQDQLAKCIKRLGIEPKTPLPKRLDWHTGLKLLTKSESPAKFMSEIKGSYPADALKQNLIYSEAMEKTVYVRQIEGMSQAEFKRIRAEAKKKQQEYRALEDRPVEQWGVVLRRAPAELSTEKLILRGAVVEKVVTEQGSIGLETGDIIIDYESIYDFVMGDLDFARSMQQLANRVKRGRKLRVLRGDRIITIGANAER
ncbi:MAG: hypothetical protein ACYTEL_04535 [Planctomycetota bacterium]|jgi:hypothetical protein